MTSQSNTSNIRRKTFQALMSSALLIWIAGLLLHYWSFKIREDRFQLSILRSYSEVTKQFEERVFSSYVLGKTDQISEIESQLKLSLQTLDPDITDVIIQRPEKETQSANAQLEDDIIKLKSMDHWPITFETLIKRSPSQRSIIYQDFTKDMDVISIASVVMVVAFLSLNYLQLWRPVKTWSIEFERSTELANQAQMLAHDVRKPINMLKIALNDLTEDLTNSQHLENFTKARASIVPQIKRATNLADQMCTDITLSCSPKKDNYQWVDLNKCLRTLVEDALVTAPLSVAFNFYVEPALKIKTCEKRFSRAVSNLLQNAIEASIEYSSLDHHNDITIRASLEAPSVLEIRIENATADLAPVIHRDPKTKFITTKINGKGLGIWSASRLLKSIGGDLIYSSNSPHRVTATLKLPVNPYQDFSATKS